MSARHILVVEDEALSAHALEDALTRKGYRVTVAADGQEGLEAMERDPADAIVTDLRMPRLDGREMICRLWDMGVDRPIIVMTGYMAFATGPNGLGRTAGGPVVVLQKPIDFNEILSTVERLVGQPAT